MIALASVPAVPQPPPSTTRTIPAVFASDFHFEPFWDPAKAPQLNAAPPSAWGAILAAPASPDRARQFAALQRSCSAKGADTSYPLLASSLHAMAVEGRGAKFVTLSGDLISHDFTCKYKTLFPNATAGDYRAFAVNTIAFVMDELRASFPGAVIYGALGNNDSGCDDYRIDAHSEFLAAAGAAMVADLPRPERRQALATFAAGGYYSVPLASVRNTRLLVLDDLFMSNKYKTCAGTKDPAPAAAQVAWLRQQLTAARLHHEKVWIMAHIPPGVAASSTASKKKHAGGGAVAPQMYLVSEDLADAMAQFGDVIQLGIFGHTHMDQLRLLEAPHGTGLSTPQAPIALKLVPAITPIGGYPSAFISARVDLETALLADYSVYTASNATGVGTVWAQEYDFAQAYRQAAFSPAAVASMIAGFEADPRLQAPSSRRYEDYFFRGKKTAHGLAAFWPLYVCALPNDTAAAFQQCLAAEPKP